MAACSVASEARRAALGDEAVDAFAFFRPTVAISRNDIQRLDKGDVLVRVLPGEDGEVAVFAAVRTTATGDRLADWVRDIADLKRSSYVSAIARFSDPPQLADVDAIVLPDGDVEAIRRCRPGSCDVKLTEPEIAVFQDAIRAAGDAWRPAVQATFRVMVADRVTRYLAEGHAVLAPYVDHGTTSTLEHDFSLLTQHSVFLVVHGPDVADYLARYPAVPPIAGADQFAYWAHEQLGGRPSITATHVVVLASQDPEMPETLVAGKQIFSTHYVSASLSITAVLRGRDASAHYLTYLNRSRLDVLDRWYGGMARRIIEQRVKGEASDVFRGLKTRLESGPPPR